jgi:hypothetical protein
VVVVGIVVVVATAVVVAVPDRTTGGGLMITADIIGLTSPEQENRTPMNFGRLTVGTTPTVYTTTCPR